MNCVVIGLGSMGRRRIRLLKNFDPTIKIVGVDRSDDRCRQVKNDFGVATFDSLEKALKKVDCFAAFVCTSPISHESVVLECLENKLHTFTEINLLSDWYSAATSLADKQKLVLFLSSTFLYRKEIAYIKENIFNEQVNYIYHCGQYLPDWHPWEDYRNFFVSNKKTNACREILAIELPWLIDAFGDIQDIYAIKSKNTQLDIDFCDNYFVVIQHENGNKGFFCQDIISRKAGRTLEVFSENLHLFWDGTPTGLYNYDIVKKEKINIKLYNSFNHHEEYQENIIEDAYLDEIKEFFNVIKNNVIPRYSFEQDKLVLGWVDKIEAE